MGQPGVGLQCPMFEELNRPRSGRRERADLIVFAMHDQDSDINESKIVVEFGFGKNLDALIVSRGSAQGAKTARQSSRTLALEPFRRILRFQGMTSAEESRGRRTSGRNWMHFAPMRQRCVG